MPFVVLKLAMSLDGRIAAYSGSSKWITGEKARRVVHRTRYESDAILVGVNTVLEDDPSLNVRWIRKSAITKVILDSNLRTPPNARLFHSGDEVLIFHSFKADSSRKNILAEQADLIEVSKIKTGLDWNKIMSELGGRRIQSLLVEGGGKTAGTLIQSGLVQRLNLFYGPLLIGVDGIPGFHLTGIKDLSEAPKINLRKVLRLGDDLMIEADPLFK
jgi:diaminohydroxyphosphoribosylaminopyrimidine deaminase/5-amino-6-(5-phosphoribosylamino)uracil reductase